MSLWSRPRTLVVFATLTVALAALFLPQTARAGHRAPGRLLAYKVLTAAHGGKVSAADGAAIKVPPGVMRHNSLVTITRMRGGTYDMNIAGPWKGSVGVTLPARRGSRGILHLIGSTWVREGGPRRGTVWVHQLSIFGWATDKLKAAACFSSLDFRSIIECLAGKGLSKIDSGLTKWLAEKAGVSDECALQIIASKGFVMALFNALTGACVAHAGEDPVHQDPPPAPAPPTTPAAPSSPAPQAPSAPAPSGGSGPAPAPAPGGVAETTGGLTHTWTNYTNAGGYEGPAIASNTTVTISCKLQGFAVADGNTWWYRIGSAPWSGAYYASADAFYNNGQVSGSLKGTPYVDPAVPDC